MCSSDLGNYEHKYPSLGKQPSWIEYTTDVNETYGEFAAGMPLAFMCLNRVYEEHTNGTISNPSMYIDPTIYNNIFAESRLSKHICRVKIEFTELLGASGVRRNSTPGNVSKTNSKFIIP